jgi:hypothetical protein
VFYAKNIHSRIYKSQLDTFGNTTAVSTSEGSLEVM